MQNKFVTFLLVVIAGALVYTAYEIHNISNKIDYDSYSTAGQISKSFEEAK